MCIRDSLISFFLISHDEVERIDIDRADLIQSDTLLYPNSKHREQSKLIYQLLTKYHYKKLNVNDSLSEKILEKYIKSLDPSREYFYQSDITYFNQYQSQMDDYVISGYLEPAYEIFTVYHERVKNRIDFVFSLLENEPNFSVEEEFTFDRKDSQWFKNDIEMDNYWRKKIKNSVSVPLVADIHFDYKIALLVADSADCLRINPGNIGKENKVQEIIQAAKDNNIPIRVGVNAGSLEKDLQKKYGEPNSDALVESALRHVDILDRYNFSNFKLSLKASNIQMTVESYRKFSKLLDQPLHLGITESGSYRAGSVKSSIGLGMLLSCLLYTSPSPRDRG